MGASRNWCQGWVYTNNSGSNGKIGASAVLFAIGHDPKTLHYHLGSDSEHTVFEAEVLAITMAAHLLYTKRDLDLPINIFVDNQAAIKSGDLFTTKSGHYLIDRLLSTLRAVQRKHQCKKKMISLSVASPGTKISLEMNELMKKQKRQPPMRVSTAPAIVFPAFFRTTNYHSAYQCCSKIKSVSKQKDGKEHG